jgi:molybdopterin/thiamine biosynthesis adenylyltransferase
MDLSDAQIERYSRQILLREVGGEGQERILAARVLVAGGGLLSAITARYLAAAGVGELGLVGGAAGDRLAAEIRGLNPDIRVTRHSLAGVTGEVVSAYDLVVEVSTDGDLRDRLNRAAIATGCIVITGGGNGERGFVAALHPAGGGGCLACAALPSLDAAAAPLAPALTGAIGTLLATEALKAITGVGDPLTGRMVLIDARASRYTTQVITRRPACPVCDAT